MAHAVADLLDHPHTAPLPSCTMPSERRQLAYGPLGIAPLHIERAASGLGPWQRVHDWLAATTRQPFTSGADSHPFYGAPALAYTVACAAEHVPGPYQRALDTLDVHIATDVRRRIAAAHRRIDAELLPALAEFDAIRGLTGYGAYLMTRSPGSVDVRTVLDYCVRLTEPITDHDDVLPGWWTTSGPSGRPDDKFPGGHATSHGPAWPYWVTRADLHNGHLAPSGPRRPSWCYGTAGHTRAQQLAALALGDAHRQIEVENALIAALTDPTQLKATTDNGLCHG